MRLTGLEIAIFAAYIIAVMAIGFFSGRKGGKSSQPLRQGLGDWLLVNCLQY